MEIQKKLESSKRTQKDYSLSFKLQVVNEVEKGYITYPQAQRKYGIQGKTTVLTWLRKHGNQNWSKFNHMKGKQTPYSEIQELKAKIKQLEKEKYVLNTAIDVANDMFSIDIRKKCLALSLEKSQRQSQE